MGRRQWVRGTSAVGACLLAAITATAPSTGAQSGGPGVPATIVFSSGGRLFTTDASGTGRERLTGPRSVVPNDKGDGAPAYSPDGTRIAFVRSPEREDGGGTAIVVMNSDGSGPKPVLEVDGGDEGFGAPEWLPDGGRLLITKVVFGERFPISVIETIPATGGKSTEVLHVRFSRPTPYFLGSAVPLPGTDRILYTKVSYGNGGEIDYEIRSIGVDGRGDRLVRREASSPSPSADGTRIAFSGLQDRNGQTCGSDFCSINGEIYVMAADGSGVQRLTKNRGDDAAPVWSADASRIFFSSDRNHLGYGDASEVYSVGVNGSCLTWLTNGSPGSFAPDAAPGMGTVSAPAVCGEAGREPLVELEPKRADLGLDPVLWLGQRTGPMLLSRIDRGGEPGFFYGDCSRFDPRDCEGDMLIAEIDTCSRSSSLDYRLPDRLRSIDGALVGINRRNPAPVVLSGGTEVEFYAGPSPAQEQMALARELEVVGSPRAGLPRAGLPANLLAAARRAAAAVRSQGSVRAAAQELGLPAPRTRSLARLAAGVKRAGGARAIECGGARRRVAALPSPARDPAQGQRADAGDPGRDAAADRAQSAGLPLAAHLLRQPR